MKGDIGDAAETCSSHGDRIVREYVIAHEAMQIERVPEAS